MNYSKFWMRQISPASIILVLCWFGLMTSGCGPTVSDDPHTGAEGDSSLEITSPATQTSVGCAVSVEGVGARGKTVWLYVHPLDVVSERYYPQPKANVSSSGHWTAHAYIGDCTTGFKGQKYELKAFDGIEKEPRAQGEWENGWPSSERTTKTVVVVREN